MSLAPVPGIKSRGKVYEKIVFMLMMLSIAFTLSAGEQQRTNRIFCWGTSWRVNYVCLASDNPDIVQN